MIEKGKNIIAIYESVRIVFAETTKIITLFDSSFKENECKLKWESSSITNGVSSSLSLPNKWLLSGLYRIYERKTNEIVGINISFKEGIPEPILIGGKIKYNPNTSVSEWDLWHIWYDWEPKEKIFDGNIINFESQTIVDNRIDQIAIFAIPLIDIDSKNKIEKLVNKIINL